MLLTTIKYGAVTTKVRAMYGKRVKHAEYLELARMPDVAAIATWLKNHAAWGAVLQDITSENAHRGEIEMRLQKGYYEECQRLAHFASASDTKLLRQVLLRDEQRQVLFFLRYLAAGNLEEFQPQLPQWAKHNMKLDIDALGRATSYEEMLEAAKETSYYKTLKKYAPESGKRLNYNTIEVALNTHYYIKLLEAVKKTTSGFAQKQLLASIGEWIDVQNIDRALRLRRVIQDAPQQLYGYLIGYFYRISPNKCVQILTAPESKLISVLQSTPYKKLMEGTDNATLFAMSERYFHKMYHRRIYGGKPGVLVPMAYLDLKEMEIRNLVNVIESVRYELPPDQVLRFVAS